MEPEGRLTAVPFADMIAGPAPKYKEFPDKYKSLKRLLSDPKS